MRGRPLTRILAVAAAVAAVGAPPAQARSGPAERAALEVFEDFRADGAIDPCEHSSEDLKLALDSVPPDIEQYAAEYPSAIEDALEARARGDCDGAATPGGGSASGGASATPAPSAPPAPAGDPAGPTQTVVPDPPAPPTAGTAAPATGPDAELERAASTRASNDAPLPVLLLGALVALLGLTAATLALVRRLGFAEEGLAPAGHAWREAAWRAGGTWADFRDWLRLGR